jgi:hypothetical protein
MKKIIDVLLSSVDEAKGRWQKAVEKFDASRRETSNKMQEIVKKSRTTSAINETCHEEVSTDAPQHAV